MEAREPISLNTTSAEGLGLQVRFSWHQDRHCHTISLLVDGRAVPVLESLEGTSIEDWPPSPPLQQLSVEELRPQTQVALLVGMAGKSHWSMSVEPAGDRAAFVFDVACRARDAVEQLGSGYRLLAEGITTDGNHDGIITVEGRSLQLRCDRAGPTVATLRQDSLDLRIEPATIIAGGTTRWRYRIELA